VNVVEVGITGDRIRGRVDDPAGWISLASTDGRHKWALQTEPGAAESSSPSAESSYLPGSYKLIRQTQLNSSLQRKDPEGLGIFDKGRIVNVVEVGITGDRIRGRVDDPAGWISLASTDGTQEWVQLECKPPSLPAPPTAPESKPKGPSGPAPLSPESQQAESVERKASPPSAGPAPSSPESQLAESVERKASPPSAGPAPSSPESQQAESVNWEDYPQMALLS